LAGDDVDPGVRPTVTNAVSVAAPPQRVWPWLAQIGRGRAGFYTCTWFENLIGADIQNLDRIDPALQNLAVGHRIWLTPERYLAACPGRRGACAPWNLAMRSCSNSTHPRTRARARRASSSSRPRTDTPGSEPELRASAARSRASGP
jgi:hypothetical protein